jgi:hypothetical protein
MNSTTTNDRSTTEVSVVLPEVVPPEDDSARCQYLFSNGKRCRLPGLQSQSGFCSRHFRPLALSFPSCPNDFEDLSADLLPELNEFSSGEDVQKFLARLVVQVTKGRVSPRRAAVLGYLTNQLLHSHRAIDKEADNEPQKIIFDLPRPNRD